MSWACRGRRLDYVDNLNNGRLARDLSNSSFSFLISAPGRRTQAARNAAPRAILDAMAESSNSCRK